MLMGIISEDLAISSGIKIRRLNFIFLLLVALVVAVGVKIVGTLLMGALVIVPAAAAKNISRSFRQFAFWSSCFGLISAWRRHLCRQNIFDFSWPGSGFSQRCDFSC